MGLFETESLRNETKAFTHPEDVGVHGESLPVEAKQEETMKGLETNAFEGPECFLDLFGVHVFQRKEA